VLRSEIPPASTSSSFFSASDSATFDDYFNFRVALLGGRYELAVQSVINANLIAAVNRRITSDRSFHILALQHSGFDIRVHKDGTAEPIILDHGLEAAEGMPPYVRPHSTASLDGMLHAFNRVMIGAIALRVCFCSPYTCVYIYTHINIFQILD
jgi:hypothetical protein